MYVFLVVKEMKTTAAIYYVVCWVVYVVIFRLVVDMYDSANN